MEVFARSLGIKLYLVLFVIAEVQFSFAVATENVSAEETIENTNDINNNNYTINLYDEIGTYDYIVNSANSEQNGNENISNSMLNSNQNYDYASFTLGNQNETNTTTAIPTTTTPLPCSQPVNITNITVNQILKTSINLSINLTEMEEQCNYTILVTCNANNDGNWVISNVNYTLNMNNNSYEDFTLGNLSAFTNYTCAFTIEGGNDEKTITFTTEEDVPSQPTNLTLIQPGSTSFRFTWNDPTNIPTNLFGYNVSITRENMLNETHYWAHCSDEPKGFYSIFINATEDNFYYFDKALANFNYTVTVSARSSAGSGDEADLTVSTLVAASEPPGNVTYEIIEQTTTKNVEMALNISWDMPCNTNGPVNYFFIESNGSYIYNNIVQESMFNLTIVPNNNKFSYTIPELMAASKYFVRVYATNGNLHGKAFSIAFETKENYPSAPEEITYTSLLARNFTVIWNEPTNNPGNITHYEIEVHFSQIHWPQTEYCIIDNNTKNVRIYNESRSKCTVTEIVPYTSYNVTISAYTSRGKGNSTSEIITSALDFPEIKDVSSRLVQNNKSNSDQYDVNATIDIKPGCFYGDFTSYNIDFEGERDGDSVHAGNHSIGDDWVTQYSFAVRPEHSYLVNVTIKNSQFNTFRYIQFNSPAGVPTFDSSSLSHIEPITSSTEAILTLSREYFDDSQGTVKYLAIIVSDKNITAGDFFEWDSSEWPEPFENTDVYYQATSKYWNPFTDSISVINYTLGQNESCSEDEQFCNRPLQPDQTYYVFVRVFNTGYYRNSMPIMVVTDPLSKLGFILGLIFGLLGVSLIGFVAFILWRRGIIKNFLANKDQSDSKTEVSKEKFIDYCNYLEHNSEELKRQWQDLQTKSDEEYEGLKNNIALFPENRRKNRFTNILPFDHTRVKLNIEEDDEISSDYINASYIKGFSNQNEYIATQGPLPHTVRDFWKMIFQENVTVIVMVAGFIENKREKCYKYFPNNHESVLFGDDIEVRCSTELNFQIYCVRTLQVRKDVKQLTVTHMQFLEWPDFGVPHGTDNLMLFCHKLRERWATEGGMAVVHCSAGVGRTGTIIATDKLIRAIEAGKKIDVFNTVLEMRKQRKCMVQTEKQYLYIHQLIKNYLEAPIISDDDSSEHLYQNIALPTDVKPGLAESAL